MNDTVDITSDEDGQYNCQFMKQGTQCGNPNTLLTGAVWHLKEIHKLQDYQITVEGKPFTESMLDKEFNESTKGLLLKPPEEKEEEKVEGKKKDTEPMDEKPGMTCRECNSKNVLKDGVPKSGRQWYRCCDCDKMFYEDTDEQEEKPSEKVEEKIKGKVEESAEPQPETGFKRKGRCGITDEEFKERGRTCPECKSFRIIQTAGVLKCKDCGKTFSKIRPKIEKKDTPPKQMGRPKITDEAYRKVGLTCPLCGSFRVKRTNSYKNRRRCKCVDCEKSFYEDTIQTEKKTDTGISTKQGMDLGDSPTSKETTLPTEDNLTCPECGSKRAHSQRGLAQHRRMAHGVKIPSRNIIAQHPEVHDDVLKLRKTGTTYDVLRRWLEEKHNIDASVSSLSHWVRQQQKEKSESPKKEKPKKEKTEVETMSDEPLDEIEEILQKDLEAQYKLDIIGKIIERAKNE